MDDCNRQFPGLQFKEAKRRNTTKTTGDWTLRLGRNG